MRPAQTARMIPVLMVVCLLILPAPAQYSGGSGTAEDPYRIATAADLITLGETPEDYDKHFILTADIDLDPNLPGGKVFDKAVIAPDVYDAEAGFQETPFSGVFDGNGHIISHVTIRGAGYLGLFGRIWQGGATVSNLRLETLDVSGTGDCVGGLAGYNYGETVTNCHTSGVVRGVSSVGGLIGLSAGTVSICHSTAAVDGDENVGGLLGTAIGLTTDCYSTGTVTGEQNVGGLIGRNGGTARVFRCHSSGAVNGISNVGGLVGFVGQRQGVYATMAYCYSNGPVTGDYGVGGFVGVSDPDSCPAITHCFWDIQASGQTTSACGTGLTTAQMHDCSTFMADGWDFVGPADGPDDLWAEPGGGGYPILWWQQSPLPSLPSFSGGTGEPDDPYLISTPQELNSIGGNPRLMQCHFKLTTDIDLSEYSYDTAVMARGLSTGPTSLAGSLDGDGHVISNLTIAGDRGVHLIGSLASEGEVRNLDLLNVSGGLAGYNGGSVANCHSIGNVTGSGGLVASNGGSVISCSSAGSVSGNEGIGGLVGWNFGIIADCSSSSEVSGERWLGGLVGRSHPGSEIVRCCSEGSATGEDCIGGLVGHNSGTVDNCYSVSAVSGDQYVGGLVGWNYGALSNTHSVGTVTGNEHVGGLVGYNDRGTISTSFWDMETSGLSSSDGGIGKTTAEMQTASTFLAAGWDFVDEMENGPNDVWKMWDGYDYPRLSCEPGPNPPLVFADINDPYLCGQMSRYEVTNAQYCDFLNAALASGDITVDGNDVCGAGGSNGEEEYLGQRYYRCDGSGYTGYGATNGGASRIHYKEGAFGVDEGFGNHPVTYVSWYGAMAFCNYYGYSLPTEDQWQAVADYDGTYIYGCGQTIDPGMANYRDSEHPDGTVPVGSFGLYGYGMSDMAGNVWEWTSSSLDGNRIFRGGSMGSIDADCDVSIRADGIPHANYWDIGFRVCR